MGDERVSRLKLWALTSFLLLSLSLNTWAEEGGGQGTDGQHTYRVAREKILPKALETLDQAIAAAEDRANEPLSSIEQLLGARRLDAGRRPYKRCKANGRRGPVVDTQLTEENPKVVLLCRGFYERYKHVSGYEKEQIESESQRMARHLLRELLKYFEIPGDLVPGIMFCGAKIVVDRCTGQEIFLLNPIIF